MISRIKKKRIRSKNNISPEAVLYNSAQITNQFGPKDAIEIGPFSHIQGQLMTFGHGGCIKIGQYCYVGVDTRVWSAKRIQIGNRVLISHNVNIFDNITHPYSAKLRHQQFKHIIFEGKFPKAIELNERPIVIEDDVLICCMVIILPGITIGEGAIVGAGSVVTDNIPPWTIVAGNPARIIRTLSEEER